MSQIFHTLYSQRSFSFHPICFALYPGNEFTEAFRDNTETILFSMVVNPHLSRHTALVWKMLMGEGPCCFEFRLVCTAIRGLKQFGMSALLFRYSDWGSFFTHLQCHHDRRWYEAVLYFWCALLSSLFPSLSFPGTASILPCCFSLEKPYNQHNNLDRLTGPQSLHCGWAKAFACKNFTSLSLMLMFLDILPRPLVVSGS